MNQRLLGKWKAAAVAGTLVASGAAAISGCMFNRMPSEKTTSQTQSFRKEPMSLIQQRSTVLHANQGDFDEQVLRSNVPVLVDFYADWCGPCQRLAPVLEELAAETPHAKIVKVNVEDSPHLAYEFGVDSIPSLKVFKNGQITDEVVGMASKERLRMMLTR
jgi:thioredoxin 1